MAEKRLIDANALTEEYIKMQYYDQTMGIICNRYMPEIARVARQPTVDAVEVVHGRWERCWQEKSKHYFRCSNCLTAYMDGVSGAIGPEYGSRAWRYCPNCGARMDGE